MLVSPFKLLRRAKHRKQNARVAQQRLVVDGYRQPFGLRFAKQLGRPTGWIIFVALLEKISYPLIILILIALNAWEALALTIIAESLLFTAFVATFSRERRLEYTVKAISATPFRYGMMIFEIIIIFRFIFELVTGRRAWRTSAARAPASP